MAQAHTHISRGRVAPPPSALRRYARLWRGLLVLALLGVPALVVMLVRANGSNTALVAQSTDYDFGQVAMTNGEVSTRFPLTVREAAVITDVNSSCMCTRARIVQGERASDWLGMSHGGEAAVIREALEPNTPAYVEVTVDPAAHGEAGTGPFTRVVALRTATGQELQFTVRGIATR